MREPAEPKQKAESLTTKDTKVHENSKNASFVILVPLAVATWPPSFLGAVFLKVQKRPGFVNRTQATFTKQANLHHLQIDLLDH